MDSTNPRFVPKVHPATRPVLPEDPYALNANRVPGNPDAMIRAVVQEFAWMGWSEDQIVALFGDPEFPVLNSLLRALGETELRARVSSVFTTFGVYRFRSTIVEAPADPEVDLFDDFVFDDDHEPGTPGASLNQQIPSCQSSSGMPFVSLQALTWVSRKPEGNSHVQGL